MDNDDERSGAGGVDRRTVLKMTGGVVAGAAAGGASTAAARPSEVVMWDAAELARVIQARQVSCTEVMRAYLDHIDAINPRVNAIVALQDRDGLLHQAQAHDDQLTRREATGPLHGFPLAVKDLQPVKGIRYTQGSPIFRDFVATSDSIVVERMRKAGVIYVGKTNTPEFGLGSHTFNPVYGVTRNAWDQTRSAGGSSGGAAVALALHMLPVADGSDYGGSLRNPAGWNNVVGFRTSAGRVPVQARDDWLPSMGVTGPMARTVADVALLLSVQAGYDPRAPLSMETGGAQFRGPLEADMKGKRIAWAGDFGGFAPTEPAVLDTCRAALKTFETMGCVVEPAFPAYPLEKLWRSFIRLRGWQQGGALLPYYKDPATRPMLKPEAVYEVETGLKLSAVDVAADSAVRTEWSQAVRRFFERYDYLVAPTAQLFPFKAEEAWPREIAGHQMQTYHEWMKAVCLVTMSGCPSLAVPAGFGPEGLPIGVQIVAPWHQELACLKLGAAYEAASGGWVKPLAPLLGA
ncbi:amidase [Phenylobacterium sp.]|uniref:amidase n=1 Tax=Phenylobacterium sp. TaxID=1871053 RepID=UPI001229DC49|nr:amidase [Phenylobacterium sp.]THD71505.1 MAG: amidase [Phenylobacterium sp.]